MFDTLMYAKKLESAGFKRHQAEKQIQVMAEMIVDGVATKQDLKVQEALTAKEFAAVRSEMKTEFVAVRSEMATEFAAVRSEMATEFAAVRSEMTAGFAAVRSEMAIEFATVRSEMTAGFADLRTENKLLENRLTIKLTGIMSTIMAIGIAIIGLIVK